ncbi:MAG: DUF2496 domain-containing protein, partial [Plesiomonas shigelloides]
NEVDPKTALAALEFVKNDLLAKLAVTPAASTV